MASMAQAQIAPGLAWSPLPPSRDGSSTSSTSGRPLGIAFRRRQQRMAGHDVSSSRYPSPAAISAAGIVVGAACSALEHRSFITSSPAYLKSLFQRGFMSLLQLLPRLFSQRTISVITASLAAGVFTFLSLNLPSFMLFSLLGLVAFAIYHLSALSTAIISSSQDDVQPPLVCTLPPPRASLTSSQRNLSAGTPRLTASARAAAAASAAALSSKGPRGPHLRPSRRRHTMPRLSFLETVPETLATGQAPTTSLLPLSQRPRVGSAASLTEASAIAPRAAAPAAVLADLLSARGVPVTDIQLAACVSNMSAGLDVNELEAPSPVNDTQAANSCSGALASTSLSRTSSCNSIHNSIESVAGAPTVFGRARELGERMWPWVTIPVAVACVPVAVVCTLPVAVPLLCTYGVVRVGYSAVRVSTSAVFECFS